MADLGLGQGADRSSAIHAGDNIDVYFCDPQSPWQRRSNENIKGLLRQYFPISQCTRKLISTKWRVSSMSDRGRPCNLKPQRRDLTPVLRRPVEPATKNGHSRHLTNKYAGTSAGAVGSQKYSISTDYNLYFNPARTMPPVRRQALA